jgi:hypothetical protein
VVFSRPHQRYCGTGIWSGRDKPTDWRAMESPARLCRPGRQASLAHPRGKPGFSTLSSGCGRETDCPLEGDGFELPVPRELGLRRGRRLALHLGSLTLRRRGPDWNATKRRRDSERRASTAAENRSTGSGPRSHPSRLKSSVSTRSFSMPRRRTTPASCTKSPRSVSRQERR